ncbi:MAG: phosphoribosyltransferase [Rivularia sp. (in: Bacteria)]|nr:phosphoribosyltransferase [Rivularia sp. MS3]
MLYRNRTEAGQRLAQKLKDYANRPDVLVLGLPRGGVPVAFEVAKLLNAPLDVFLVRKLGVPGHEELAMGAIASGGIRILNEEVVKDLHLSYKVIDKVTKSEQEEMKRREGAYRDNRSPLDLSNRTIILVDDGLATGATMRVAAVAIRQQQPKQIIAAVPVSAPEICNEFRVEVDEIICAQTPKPFVAVGVWYEKFSQTTDAQVQDLLKRAAEREVIALRSAS